MQNLYSSPTPIRGRDRSADNEYADKRRKFERRHSESQCRLSWQAWSGRYERPDQYYGPFGAVNFCFYQCRQSSGQETYGSESNQFGIHTVTPRSRRLNFKWTKGGGGQGEWATAAERGREREGVCQLRPVGQKPEQGWEKEEGKMNLYRFIVQSEAFLLFSPRYLHLELFGPLHFYQLVPLERALSGIRWWSVIPFFFEENSQVPKNGGHLRHCRRLTVPIGVGANDNGHRYGFACERVPSHPYWHIALTLRYLQKCTCTHTHKSTLALCACAETAAEPWPNVRTLVCSS